MRAILTLRADHTAPVSETFNLSARGTDEAQNIAGWYAESNSYRYWELKFNQSADDAPRLIRNGNQLRIARA